ncbi:VWA domain-containing protein [Candidatus Gracilibacteria bacterium]|nr:VWA domain-containing protein [Candidatus Gracilibacteria bacterium]
MKHVYHSYFSLFRALLGSIFLILGILLFLSLGVNQVSLFRGGDEASLIIIDQSLSMAIEDVNTAGKLSISRLDKAKELLQNMQVDTGHVGVILFAKNPTLLIPISPQISDFYNVISSIEPESELGGSDLLLALQFAKNLYGDRKLSINIYTDGGSTSLSSPPKIPQNWRVKIYGIGSEIGGKIPLGYNANGERRYKYFSGSEVIIAYEKSQLAKVSKAIGATLIDGELLHSGESTKWGSFFSQNVSYLLASLFLLIGIITHPYGRKKISHEYSK